eukprot:scaffold2232_cov365-Prasinococcus_capsulatus_cf.AAC.8
MAHTWLEQAIDPILQNCPYTLWNFVMWTVPAAQGDHLHFGSFLGELFVCCSPRLVASLRHACCQLHGVIKGVICALSMREQAG